jgi:hypothetical protein
MSHTTYSTPPNTPASARPWLRRTLRQESRSPPRIVRANRASCPRRKAAGFARRADGSLAELIQKLDAAILKSEGLQVCSRRTLGNAVKRFLAEHGGFDADGKYRGDSEYSTYRKYWWCGTSSPMRSWPIRFRRRVRFSRRASELAVGATTGAACGTSSGARGAVPEKVAAVLGGITRQGKGIQDQLQANRARPYRPTHDGPF